MNGRTCVNRRTRSDCQGAGGLINLKHVDLTGGEVSDEHETTQRIGFNSREIRTAAERVRDGERLSWNRAQASAVAMSDGEAHNRGRRRIKRVQELVADECQLADVCRRVAAQET